MTVFYPHPSGRALQTEAQPLVATVIVQPDGYDFIRFDEEGELWVEFELNRSPTACEQYLLDGSADYAFDTTLKPSFKVRLTDLDDADQVFAGVPVVLRQFSEDGQELAERLKQAQTRLLGDIDAANRVLERSLATEVG